MFLNFPLTRVHERGEALTVCLEGRGLGVTADTAQASGTLYSGVQVPDMLGSSAASESPVRHGWKEKQVLMTRAQSSAYCVKL